MSVPLVDRAIADLLRLVPLSVALNTATGVVTQEACFVRSIGCFHAQNNLSVAALHTRGTAGTIIAKIVRFGIGNAQKTFRGYVYMPNGFALGLGGAVGTATTYGAAATFVKVESVPWLRGLDRPDISEIYARAMATKSEINRG